MILMVLSVVGSAGFALSGALVGLERDYDIFGVLVLGLVTAFGGGIVRNLIVGIPVAEIWHQGPPFVAALVAMMVAILLPITWNRYGKTPMLLFDAIGLATFAVEGALYAVRVQAPLGAIVAAATITGIGGGIIRDVLAQRKPLVLREEIYAAWALLAGLVVGLGLVNPHRAWQVYTLILLVFSLRFLSVKLAWHLPRGPKPPRAASEQESSLEGSP